MTILVYLLLPLFVAQAQESVPAPASARFPNIRASLSDGFFSLAEQQARGVLVEEPGKEDEQEAVLLLSHALWGQKRYSELLNLLNDKGRAPGMVYWRARAHFELKEFDAALKAIADGGKALTEDKVFAPAALRLRGHLEQRTGALEAAEASFSQFAKDYAAHAESVPNQFDLAEVLTQLKRLPDAVKVYEALVKSETPSVSPRAKLRLANLLYRDGNPEQLSRGRGLLNELAADESVKLAYRIDAWVDLVELEEKSGNRPKAVEALRQAIKLSPDARQRVPLKLALVRMQLVEGRTDEALKLIEECRAEAPDQETAAELQLEKAKALLQAHRYQEADAAYQVYLGVADDPAGLAQAHFGKGLVLLELERFDEAATMLDKAVKELKEPGLRADALFKAGDAFYRAGKFEDAEKRYRAFVTDYPQNAHAPNALYQLGLALARTGRRADALEMFQTLEKQHPKSSFAEQSALRAADVMLAGEQWEPALKKFTQISQTYTNSSAAAFSLHQRGLLLYRLGRYAEAQKAFEGVVADYAESEFAPQAVYMRGFSLYLQGQVQEAVKACQKFIEAYPDSTWASEVIFWLAEQSFNRGEYREAETLFLRIADEYKESKLAARALYWAGRAAAAQSSYVKAIERYSKVAKTYPNSEILPQTRFAQGDALTELGDFSRAILAFEEIIKNYPENDLVSAAWGRKGDCQFSLSVENPARYAEAINSYQAILDRSSSPPALKLQAEYKIGRCFEKINAPDKAFSRYMNGVVYTFINENIPRSTYSTMWFTRAAFGAAALKEKEGALLEAVQIYKRVVEADVPAKEEALKRIAKIKKDNWLLFQQAGEAE